METKLVRIAQIAKERPKEVFTSLYHHLDKISFLFYFPGQLCGKLHYQNLFLMAYS